MTLTQPLLRFGRRLPLVRPPRVQLIPGRHLSLRAASATAPSLVGGHETLRLVSPWRGAVPWGPLLDWGESQGLCTRVQGWTLRGPAWPTPDAGPAQAELTADLDDLLAPIGAALESDLRGAQLADRLVDLAPEDRRRLMGRVRDELEERGYALSPTDVPRLTPRAQAFTGQRGRIGLLLLAADSRGLDGVWLDSRRPRLRAEDPQSGGLLLWRAVLSPPQGHARVTTPLNLSALRPPEPISWQG